MADHDSSDKNQQIQDLARMVFLEMQRQINANWPANAAIIAAGSLSNVLIEGHIDLIGIAAALITRYDLAAPDIETVSELQRRALPRS